jgi:hypothetical protein
LRGLFTRAPQVRWNRDGGESIDRENDRITIDFDASNMTADGARAVSKDSVERLGTILVDAIE